MFLDWILRIFKIFIFRKNPNIQLSYHFCDSPSKIQALKFLYFSEFSLFILVKSVKPVPPQKKQSISSKDQAAVSADFHKFTGDIQRLLESASSNIHTAKRSIVASIE